MRSFIICAAHQKLAYQDDKIMKTEIDGTWKKLEMRTNFGLKASSEDTTRKTILK
jgi:hypothetical protein